MRFILTFLLIIVVGFFAEIFFAAWWVAALVAGLAGLLSRLRTGEAFLVGFWGIGIMWLGVFLYRDVANNHHLASKMAELFHLPAYLFYLIATFILGGITGGLPAWAGAQLRAMTNPIASN